jgi:hypothetical protein
VSDAMPDVKQAYAAQGTDEYGTAGAR